MKQLDHPNIGGEISFPFELNKLLLFTAVSESY